MMLKMPRLIDRKARFVGTQVWNAEESFTRYWLVGVQCSGRLAGKTAEAPICKEV